MKLALLAVCALALPAAASAQAFGPPPSVGEALDRIDRLELREPGLDQSLVLPERPGENQVSWYGFRWHQYDVVAPGGGPGGIRLYFYETERAQAQHALPAIRSAYARLVDAFHYSPTRRIPYILYATQREFQTTNVFEVSESVLGVTSPQDLKMTVPYFGDHARFVEVSTHEMVHQFTIQKLLEASGSDDVSSPIGLLPLWYIEGIAEYYSKGGIDVETDLFLRDLVFNPDPKRHYEVLPFGEDRLRGYIPTYKLGQARIAFIAEVYGREKVQGFLENAFLLGDGSQSPGGSSRSFGALVRRVLDEPIEQVDERWRAWLKRRYYPAYLAAKQDLPNVREVRNIPDEPESFAASPDGTLLLVRGIDRERGRAKVYLMDARNPRGAVELAADGLPGFESLHPIEYRTLAVAEDTLVFSAQDGPGDALYVQRLRHRAPAEGKPAAVQAGRRRRVDLRTPEGGQFIQIADPALSPDATQVAFVGVGADGQQDLYVAPVKGGEARRLTRDGYAEKDVSWGASGIYYSSDATDHGLLNLFRIDPATGAVTRLTTAPSNDRHPQPQADGSVLFSSDAGGKPDLWSLDAGKIRRLTDFTTGLSSPQASAKGRGVYASTFHGGHFRVVEVPRAALLDGAATPVGPVAGDVLPIPVDDFPAAIPTYDAFDLGRNWRPEAGIVYGGGASNAVAGRAAVLFDDLLRDHVLFVDLAVVGSFDYTQALVLFENRSRRTSWILGGFHFVQQQLDRRDPNLVYLQRDFGVTGALRYPLDRFRRVDAELTIGGIQRFCLTDFSGSYSLVCSGTTRLGGPYGDNPNVEWARQNDGVNLTLSPALRYGYDTVRYDPYTGPIAGSSLLVELGGGYLPGRGAVHAFARTDAERYWQIVGRSNFMLRLAAGSSFSPGGKSAVWERSWWLSSADNLRGFNPFDLGFLIGQHYYVVNAELQFPLEPVLRLAIFDYLEGVAALDFGGVFNHWESSKDATGAPIRDPTTGAIVAPGFWDSRTLTGVLGVNVLFGPLLLRVHFGHPYDIGGLKTPAMITGSHWVTNVTLRYFFF